MIWSDPDLVNFGFVFILGSDPGFLVVFSYLRSDHGDLKLDPVSQFAPDLIV